MLTIFDYLRQKARDSVVEGVWEAAEMLKTLPVGEEYVRHENGTIQTLHQKTNKQRSTLPSAARSTDESGQQPHEREPENNENRPARKRGRPRKSSES